MDESCRPVVCREIYIRGACPTYIIIIIVVIVAQMHIPSVVSPAICPLLRSISLKISLTLDVQTDRLRSWILHALKYALL